MVFQGGDFALAQHTVNRIFDRKTGFFIDDENLIQPFAFRFILFPSGQVFTDRVHEFYPTLAIGGDDTIANACERALKPLALFANGLFLLTELGEAAAASPVENEYGSACYQTGDRQCENRPLSSSFGVIGALD